MNKRFLQAKQLFLKNTLSLLFWRELTKEITPAVCFGIGEVVPFQR
jgi:hypothetical protein